MRKILYALTIAVLLTFGVAAQQGGGAFVPEFAYDISGAWNFSGTVPTLTNGGSIVGTTTTQTLTNKTLTAPTIAAATLTGAIVRTSYTTQIGTRAKVGTTAGWVVGAANDLPYIATMVASQAGGTLVIPIDGLHIGDTITGFRVVAQIESAANTVTIDAALRAVTNVASEPTDAAIGTGMTQISVAADTASSQAKTGLTETVTSGKTYYLLITATTTASTDIILQACEITVTQS